MTKLIIRDIRARPLMVPLRRPLASASGAMQAAALLLIDLKTEEGITGRAYLFGFGQWTLKPLVGCVEGVRDLIKGDAVAPIEIDAKVRKRLTLLDPNGLIGLALSGIDMCAWDALAQARGVPLVELLGGQVRPIKAYNSCGLWIQPVEQLADEAQALLAEGNFSAVKLRLGRDDPAHDLAAVRAVKQRLGDRYSVMCDFNQRLTWNEAIQRGRMIDDEGLYWIEEPIRHDDYAGCAQIAAALNTPLQTGENLADTFELLNALQAKAMDFVMPDVQRIGGVTGWLRAAAICHAYGIEMSSHLFPEYSAHLLAVSPTCHWLEYMDWSVPLLQEPFEIEDGHVVIPRRPGVGMVWNEEAVAHYTLS